MLHTCCDRPLLVCQPCHYKIFFLFKAWSLQNLRDNIRFVIEEFSQPFISYHQLLKSILGTPYPNPFLAIQSHYERDHKAMIVLTPHCHPPTGSGHPPTGRSTSSDIPPFTTPPTTGSRAGRGSGKRWRWTP